MMGHRRIADIQARNKKHHLIDRSGDLDSERPQGYQAETQQRSFEMSLSILNNVSSLAAQNQLSMTQASLQKTLLQLSSGSRLNTGADDAAGLAIADGLHANITALTQSARNASDGVGSLQVADGALAQVTALLNRAVTLATEASTGTVSDPQRATIDAEFTAIKAEIDRIGSSTNYNGGQVFTATATSIYLSDGTTGGSSSITVTTGALASSAIGFSGTPVDLSADDLTSAANAQAALGDLTTAITNVAADRGALGAETNRLQSASSVITNQVQNLTNAEDGIRAADIPSAVASMSRLTILQQTGMAALQQSNQMQQSVLKLLQ
jgi:flagellin